MNQTPGRWIIAVLALGLVPGYASARADQWQADHDAGWKAFQEGRLGEAERLLRSAETQAKARGDQSPELATTLDHLAWVLCAEGKAADAEPLAKRALAIREGARGLEHDEVAQSLNTLACLYDAEGKLAEAEPLYERGLAIAIKTRGPGDPKVAATLDNLAASH